jgi:kynurenine formamidase
MRRAEHRLTHAAFQALADRVCNWGRWGDDDALGTLNFLTPDCRRAGAALVLDGQTVSCARDITGEAAIDDDRPALHLPFWSREKTYGVALEVLTIAPHGWTTTHLDALSHMNYRGRMYNNRPVLPFVSEDQGVNSVLSGKEGIAGRGVLIDLPPVVGKPWLDPGEIADMADIERALERQRVEVRSGDIVFIRTGRTGRDRVRGTPPTTDGLAGVSIECAEWVHRTGIATLICDAGMDPQPSEVDEIRIPWHIVTLVMMGMMITDNADLEGLAEACSARDRWEFFATLAPLRLPKANASPVNPIAIF